MNIRSPVVALCTLFTTTSTFARPPYPMQIPNGTVASCSTCHPGADRSIRNVFGIDAAASNPGAENGVNWIVLCPQDSDDDGETNGFELGDPDCFWTMGTAPSRTNNITRPGDPTSFGGGEGEGEGEGEGDVGEGEGEPLPVGEGEGEPLPVGEGEGEPLPVGEGEGEPPPPPPVGEGEGEPAPVGEGEGEGDRGEELGCQATAPASLGVFVAFALLLRRRR